MKTETKQALLNAFDYLQLLNDDNIKPKDAQTRLQTLRTQNSPLEINLLWEEEVYDNSTHYDVLIRLEEEESTISLSYCPDRALPWPMRGVNRWSDKELVRVNDIVLQMDQAIACIDFIWDEKRIIDRLIKTCLIQEELERKPVELTDDELQFFMNGFRRTHRLYTPEATYEYEARLIKLRTRVANEQVDSYFEKHQSDFDMAQIALIELSEQSEAQELAKQIQNGELNFYQAAQDSFLSHQEMPKNLFRVISRRDIPDAFIDVFDVTPGTVLGPIKVDEEYVIIKILSTKSAVLDRETCQSIQVRRDKTMI